jgi:hypothetical protein
MAEATFRLVETCTGEGELLRAGDVLGPARYRIERYQGMMPGSGMPVPGLHRIEGRVEMDGVPVDPDRVGADVTLRLDDGRTLAMTLIGRDGGVRAEGHGPGRGCSCC